MRLNVIFKIVAAFLLVVAVSGCGDGNSETNGTLTLTNEGTPIPPVNGIVNLKVSSVLTPIQVGSEINFSAVMYNQTGGSLGATYSCTGQRPTDTTGTATFSCNIPQPPVNATLEVNATSGGLAAIPLHIFVPSL